MRDWQTIYEYIAVLYRQGERARFVRYQGEEHKMAHRVIVLNQWQRMADWLAETLPARP